MHIKWKPRRDDITRRAQCGHGGSTTLTLTTPWRWWDRRHRKEGAGTTGMEALRPTLWRKSDGLVTRRLVG